MYEISFEERFALLVDRQWIWKEDHRMKRMLKNVKLKIIASIDVVDSKKYRWFTIYRKLLEKHIRP